MQAMVTGPLATGLTGRMAVGYFDERGWADNLATGGRLGGSRTFQTRGVLAWEPASLFKLRLSADYTDNRTNAATFRNAATPPIPAAPAPFGPTPQVPLPRAELDAIEDGRFALNHPTARPPRAAASPHAPFQADLDF